MTATMSKRPRMQFDLSEEIKLAIRLECAKRDCSPSELVIELVTEHCRDSLKIAKQHMPKPKD